MSERKDIVTCLACPDGANFKKIDFNPQTLEHVALADTFQPARDGECSMKVTYEDPQGVICEAEVEDILVPYEFGVYLENKNSTGSH